VLGHDVSRLAPFASPKISGTPEEIAAIIYDSRLVVGVDTGLPMLLVHRTGWAENGQIVEWTRSIFRGDRFRFVARHRLGDDVPLPVAASIGS